MTRTTLKNQRPKAIWGIVIPAVASLASAVIGGAMSNNAQKKAAREQQRIQEEQNRVAAMQNEVNTFNQYQSTLQPVDDYYEYALGGKRKGNDLHITDGGYAVPLGNNTFLLRGGSHQEYNESGNTGIGLEANGRAFEAQGGEVVKNDGNNIKVFSNEIPYGTTGKSIAQVVADGSVSPSSAFKLQQAFKKHYGLNDDGTVKQGRVYANRRSLKNIATSPVGRRKAPLGARWYTPDYIGLGVNVLGSLLANRVMNSNYNNLLKMYDNAILPDYTEEAYTNMDTRWRNDAEHAVVERVAQSNLDDIRRNTASASNALQRSQDINIDRQLAHNKLFDEAYQKNLEARIKNKELEQQVRGRNAQARNAWSISRAEMQNQILRDKAAVYSSKISDNVGMIQGIGSSIGNFLQQGMDNYQNDIAKGLITSTAIGQTPERVDTYAPGFYNKEDIYRNYSQRLREYQQDPTEEKANLVNYWVNRLPDKYKLRHGITNTRYFPLSTKRYNRTNMFSSALPFMTPKQILG